MTDDIETTDDIESELDGLMADNCWVAKEPEDFASEALSRFDEYYQAYQT